MIESLSPGITAMIISIINGLFALIFIKKLPEGFKRNFSPAIYIIPLMAIWGTFIFSLWLYNLSPIVFYLFIGIIPIGLIALFIFILIKKARTWIHVRHLRAQISRRYGDLPAEPHRYNEANIKMDQPPISFSNDQILYVNDNNGSPIDFVTHKLLIRSQTKVNFEDAPLIQYGNKGKTTWQPIPIIELGPDTPLTQDWISIKIETPTAIGRFEKVVIRVDITNNHLSKRLVDEGLLEVRFPTGASQVFGPDMLDLQPNGDTLSLYYTWDAPGLPGNYVIRYYILNLQARVEKAIKVD